tara:strand:- start:40355 stop:41050 length:696 start_codon:yes stop_codon:yes gene_type:complete
MDNMDFTTIVDFDGRKFTMHLVNDTDGKRARPIDSISKTIWKTKAFYSQNELRRSLDLGWVHKDSVVLDCGANIGNHSVFWGAHCKEVHAFEPFPEAFKILKQNVRDNNVPVICYNKLLRHSSGKCSLQKAAGYYGSNRFVNDPQGKYEAVTLDEVLDESIKPTFMKIDVEGDEYRLLKGAERIIRDHHPIIFVEVHCSIQNNLDDLILSYLTEFGYELDKDLIMKVKNKS